jgi:hypothetical protein
MVVSFSAKIISQYEVGYKLTVFNDWGWDQILLSGGVSSNLLDT